MLKAYNFLFSDLMNLVVAIYSNLANDWVPKIKHEVIDIRNNSSFSINAFTLKKVNMLLLQYMEIIHCLFPNALVIIKYYWIYQVRVATILIKR